MKACTLCLKTKIKLYQLGNSDAANFIQGIFVNNGYQTLSRLNYICFICKHLLNKCFNFIQRTLRAQKALKDMLTVDDVKVTVPKLLKIDREKYDLDINLRCQKTEDNYNVWDSNNNDDYDKVNQSNEDYVVKSEVSESGISITLDYNLKADFEDTSYDDIYVDDPIQVKTEKVADDIEAQVMLDPCFSEDEEPLVKTLRSGSYVMNTELPDFNVKNKTKKVKSKPKEELEDGQGTATKRKRKWKRKSQVRKKKEKVVDPRTYPMKCEQCKYVVQNKTEHYHHYLFYHQGIPYPYRRQAKYICQYCGIVKTSPHVLKQHELTHGEKKVECQQCGKMFHNDTRLKLHLRRHGAVLMICDYCNKGFVAREDLILHIRTHTGVKPFKCVICGAAFAHRGNVAIHMRSRHQLPPLEGAPPARGKRSRALD